MSGLRHVLMLPDFERAERIGEFWATRRVPSAELLTDCEEDRTLPAVLVGMLLEYVEVSAHTELQERG